MLITYIKDELSGVLIRYIRGVRRAACQCPSRVPTFRGIYTEGCVTAITASDGGAEGAPSTTPTRPYEYRQLKWPPGHVVRHLHDASSATSPTLVAPPATPPTDDEGVDDDGDGAWSAEGYYIDSQKM